MSTSSGRPSEHDPDEPGHEASRPDAEDVLAPSGASARPGATGDTESTAGTANGSTANTRPTTVGRRSPWHRTRDRVAAVTLAVVTVLAGVLVWATSDSRATSQRTAEPPEPLPSAPSSVPPELSERWRAPSTATPVPITAGDTVVTAAEGRVIGRDPLSGAQRWHYTRERPLCTVAEAFSRVHAVYASEHNCSEVTQLDPGTGRRTAQRNGDAEHGTRLVGGDGHVTATGDQLLNTWRSDLVLTLEYGRVPAPVNPDRQPRPDCTYTTVGTEADRVAVIEDCPADSGARLTVLKAAGDEADKPEEEFSTVLAQDSATLLAVSEDAVAVALPDSGQLVRYDHQGTRLGTHRLPVPADELDRRWPGLVVPSSESGDNRYVFTGSHTLALDADTLTPRWTAEGTLGPGTTFANSYVVPIPRGLAVLDERDGRTLRTIAVDRRQRDAPVRLASAGPVLLEQRGDTVVALR